MKLKRFEALTLQEALQAVKAELGVDAVIVSTRRITKNAGLFGLLTQPLVEVTAAVDRTSRRDEEAPSLPDMAQRETLAQARLGNVQSWYEPDKPAQAAVAPSFGAHFQIASMLEPVTEQLTAFREEMKTIQEERTSTEVLLNPLRQEIEHLRTMMEGMVGDRVGRRASSLPAVLNEHYEMLLASGISAEFSFSLLKSVAETLGENGLTQHPLVRDVLKERMAQAISVSGPLVVPGGVQKVVMLVGPTGVGKTTTVAKLASHFAQGATPVKTVVITLDTYRVAAVEQLRVYARILRVPLEVAVTSDELPVCVAKHPNAGLILIDTAGRSPLDSGGQRALATLSQKGFTLETHLVLAAPTDCRVLHDVVRRYTSLPIHRLLLTKLDETTTCGPLLNLAHHTGLPVSYLTTGQRVPEDFEEASATVMVERLFFSNTRWSEREKEADLAVGAA